MSSGSAAGSLDSGVGGGSLELFRRGTYRTVAFFALAYVVSYRDRVNGGIAKLQMVRDVGLTEETFAWGASIFFWSYMLLEVPSNLILQRVGARVWISRIMISWGVVSMLMALAVTPPRFYALRFLLALGPRAVGFGGAEQVAVLAVAHGGTQKNHGISSGREVRLQIEAERPSSGTLREPCHQGALGWLPVRLAVSQQRLKLSGADCTETDRRTAGANGGQQLARMLGHEDDVRVPSAGCSRLLS